MKYILKIVVLILIGFHSLNVQSQTWKDKFLYRGYVKDLRILNLANDSANTTHSLQQNLIHNRMNFRYYANQNLSFGLELRNRIFYGEFLKYYPPSATYGTILDKDPGSVDMNYTWMDDPNIVAHTAIDRLWINWANDEWDIRLGRHRINWGQNLVWNPNDLFNVLNYADFDYEERPGMDGLRLQRYFKNGSAFEFTYQLNDSWEETVTAMMYRFNKKSYDIQLLAGKYVDDLALGIGWAGNIKNSGFKGEATWFEPMNDSSSRQFLTAISWDYSFKKGTYLHTSFLYNDAGVGDLARLTQLSTTQGGQLNVKNLMPNKYSLFVQSSHQFHPLLSTSIASIYSIDIEGLFIMPTLGYSLRQDLDLSLVAQIIMGKTDRFRSLGSGIFLRLKWSHST